MENKLEPCPLCDVEMRYGPIINGVKRIKHPEWQCNLRNMLFTEKEWHTRTPNNQNQELIEAQARIDELKKQNLDYAQQLIWKPMAQRTFEILLKKLQADLAEARGIMHTWADGEWCVDALQNDIENWLNKTKPEEKK